MNRRLYGKHDLPTKRLDVNTVDISKSQNINPDKIALPVPSLPLSDEKTTGFAPLWLQWTATILAAVVVLSFGQYVFLKLASFKTAPPREDPKPNILRVETFLVEQAVLDRSIAGFGTAQADIEVTVSAEVNGRITEKSLLDVGMSVQGPEIVTLPSGESSRNQGKIIIQIDPQTYQERVTQVEFLIEQDQVNLARLAKEKALNKRLLLQQRERLETITADYERTLELYQKRAESETTLRQKKLEQERYRETLIRLENAEELFSIRDEEIESQRDTHRSDLKLAQLELEKATVRAPVTGMLSEVSVEEGQYLRVGDPIAKITSLDRVEVPVAVTLEDAAIFDGLIKLKQWPVAQLVRRETDLESSEGEIWEGYVRRVAPTADEQTRTVLAFVEVENSQQHQPLRPGTFVHARIQAGIISPQRGVLIPRDALLNGVVFVASKKSDSEDVAIADFNVAKPRNVTVRQTYQSFALISKGLEPGEEVVTTNLDIVAENSLLDVREVHSLDGEFLRVRIPYIKRHVEMSETVH